MTVKRTMNKSIVKICYKKVSDSGKGPDLRPVQPDPGTAGPHPDARGQLPQGRNPQDGCGYRTAGGPQAGQPGNLFHTGPRPCPFHRSVHRDAGA